MHNLSRTKTIKKVIYTEQSTIWVSTSSSMILEEIKQVPIQESLFSDTSIWPLRDE